MLAEQILAKVSEILNQLNELARFGQDNLPMDEEVTFRHAVGKVMGELSLEVIHPLLEAHPDLAPEQVKRHDENRKANE